MDNGRNKFQNRPKRRNNHRKDNNNTNNNNNNMNHDAAKNRNERDKRVFEATNPISYKTLEIDLKIDNDAEFILKLSSRMNGFLILLDQQSIRADLMCLILAALAKASQSSSEQDTIQLLVHFYMKIIPKLGDESNFLRELKLYIIDMSRNCSVFSPSRQKHIDAVQNLLIFLRRLQLAVYQKSYDAVHYLMELITAQIEYINGKGNNMNEYIVEMVAQLNESVDKVKEMIKETENTEILMEPPEDFRQISIYPSTFDILSNHEPFIRKNVVEGKYAAVDHYLDVQFRLLREDFVRSLRDGINQYRDMRNKADDKKRFHIDKLNIYKNVQIYGSKMMHSEQMHSCRFDVEPFRKLRWEYSKRMMNGSLVCLSQDDFETFFFATVAGQRDPQKLAKGEFQIKLEVEDSAMPEISPLITFVMVESLVYFEAYRHNLKVLQQFGKDDFPLERYIVNVDKHILPPSYLTNDSVYLISNGLPDGDPKAKLSAIDMLSNRQWPSREDFNLDESQYEAFRAALTKQMVVIQGPPGTGKTYIGLRIVEVLLTNTSQWPILIVCYTNHALDQFLEGILKFCSEHELVRIGGKSQCPALEKHNLSSIKSSMKSEVPSFIHKGRRESNQILKLIQDSISIVEKNIEHITDTVLGNELSGVIKNLNPRHLLQLQTLANERSLNEGILNWLGFAVKTGANQQQDIDFNLDVDDEVIQEVIEEEMDKEEVKEMEDQRYIDESSDDEEEIDYIATGTSSVPINLNHIIPVDFEDADGFKVQKKKRKQFEQQIKREIKKSETMSEDQAMAVADINQLLPNNRWNLYRLWIKLYVQEFENQMKVLRDQYKTECLRFNGLRQQEDIEIVKKAKIIGMTTTGAAKYRHIIDGTKPKITVVEEAAEVLEAHIVTALCKQTDHLILIGDHLQLRPNPAEYDLAKKFNLEISLFERLIKNQMEYYQLKQQHRMRPCISSLLVPHIYKQLFDHPSVHEYENVKGISKNMYFLNHSKYESSVEETRSHMNEYEAQFIVELCRYVVLQGYETSQVTILTTYSGQLQKIRQLMRGQNLLKGVRATVVDNYQGEECDIILLSFVRSNEAGNIGFLKDSHRVNVALSRARKGLYCIGNFDCLSEKSELWTKLLSDLKGHDAIGDALEVYCQNHTDYKTQLRSKVDFNRAPEGGCSKSCGFRLPCGHACASVCHIIDMEHVDLYKNCSKPCNKILCERDHRCKKQCHEGKDCGECNTSVEKLRPECQHLVRVSCSGNPSLAHCKSPCEKYRTCFHKCKNVCGALCEATACMEQVPAKSPCGHTVVLNCSDTKNETRLLNACTRKCDIELKCGHLCKGSCGQCKMGRLHISCKEKCGRLLICGHPCKDKCSIDCPPCKEKCTNSCVHSKCSFLCGDPCPPCKEQCAWRCEHVQCSRLCSEPCDRQLCKHPSDKQLKKCGHPSIGVCGEVVPSLCRICDKDEVEEIFFGTEDEEGARFIELVDCKHVIEVEGLLNWMNAEQDANPRATDRVSIQLKKCPKCKTDIRHTKALNTFIQACLKDVQQVKLVTYGKPKENRTLQRDLNAKTERILTEELFKNNTVKLSTIYADILQKTKFNAQNKHNFVPKPKPKLIELDNKFTLVERLQQICLNFEKRDATRKNICDNAIKKFVERIHMLASFIKEYQSCDQKRHDIETEMSFLQIMEEVIVQANAKPFNDAGKRTLDAAFELAHRYGSATEIVRNEFKKLVNEAFKHSTGLGISLEEKNMVLQAMGFQRGHWYKCPNGHIYCIGDCGGAMEQAKCPECKAVIGGGSHRLVSGNTLASEMDGATAPAWPTNLL